MTIYVPRGPTYTREILELFIWVEYVPRGHSTPRDILESFIWVKGGNRVTYDPLQYIP